MIKSPKDAVVSARLHHRTKEKLVKSGYTPAEAIEWFVHVYYENNPQKRIKIKRDMIHIRLNSLKKIECDVQVEIEALERQLDSLSDCSDIEEESCVIEDEGEDEGYPVEIQEAIELVQGAFDTKRDMLVSPKVNVSEAVDSFIVMHGDVVQGAFKMCKGLKWKEFRDILLAEIS